MTRLLTAGLALVAALSPSIASADTLHRSGPAEDRLDLVILADGYRASDRADFEAEARRVWEDMRTTEPFARYAGLMNVHTGFRASSRSGPGSNNAYGTRFRTTFGTLLYASRSQQILADAVRAGGEADAVLVIVPSNRRGGTAVGPICYVTTGAGPAVAVHELGHVIGGLGDEYTSWSGKPSLTRAQTAQRYPNLTTASARAQLPWKDWVEPSTPVPASFFTRGKVSAFKGGGAYSSGVYRSERSCRMRSDRKGFCAVCRQHLVLALHEDSTPLALDVAATSGGKRARIVSALPGSTWHVQWSGIQAQGLEALVPAGAVGTARVEDRTPWVRGSWRSALRYRFDVQGGPSGPVLTGRIVGVTTRLRVRANASTSSAILGHLGPNASVQVTGPALDGFYPIAFQGGQGYVGANFVDLGASVAGIASSLGGGQ